jgi:hypothetical protein
LEPKANGQQTERAVSDDDRQKACYEQNFEQARSLNVQMNNVPVLAMTLTGGLWFGAGVTQNLPTEIRFALLLFAGLCNLALILAILRIRDVLESYLEKIKEFHPQSFASGRPVSPKIPWLGSYSMISIYAALMFIGGIFSFFGAFWKYWPFELCRWLGVAALISILFVLYLILFRHGRN